MSKKTLLCLVALSLVADCAASNNRTRGNGVLYDGVDTLVQADMDGVDAARAG